MLKATLQQIHTKGAMPEEVWSDTEKKYIFAKGPYPGEVLEIYFGHQLLGTFEHVARITSSPDVYANRTFGPKWDHWTHYKVLSTFYAYRPIAEGYRKRRLINPPVKLRKLTDQEFEQRKAEYVAKYGYSVAVPEIQDVLHGFFPRPLTDEEEILWRTHRRDLIPPYRQEEIAQIKADKKRRYLAMLGSPTPKVVRAFGSYANMVDDLQDTAITAVVLGRIAVKLFPTFLRRLARPMGVALLAGDILNIMSLFALMPFLKRSGKRAHYTWSALNPFSKEAKALRLRKLARWVPTAGDLLQAGQVSQSVIGVGISLGPILGCLQNVFFGNCRAAAGQQVKWIGPELMLPRYVWRRFNYITHAPQLNQGGQVLTDEEHVWSIYGALGSARILAEIADDEDIVNFLKPAKDWFIEAPAPRDPLTIDVLNEIGVDIEATRLWPSTGQRWSRVQDLIDSAIPDVTQNLTDLTLRHSHDELGIIIGGLTNLCSSETMALYCGEDNIEEKHCPETEVAQLLMRQSKYFPYDITQDQQDQLAHFIHTYSQVYQANPPIKEVLRRGEEIFGSWRETLPTEPKGKAAEIFPDYLQLKQQYGEESYLA